MAARLGVSAKALRVYEREGLISPGRTEAGWRVYGPAQAARLHQIMALRGLGLSLKRIKALLVDDQASLADILALQRDSLAAQRGKLDAAIGLLGLALRALQAGRDLTLDDLTQLTKETVMNQPTPMGALGVRMKALIGERLPDQNLKTLAGLFTAKIADSGRSKADVFQEMLRMTAEGKAIMAEHADDSEAAKAFLGRWRAAFADVPRDIEAEAVLGAEVLRDALVEAMHEPGIAERLPFDPAVFDFIRRVTRGMKERGEMD
jgi:DNA-binding transcriptional MerR regulator